MEISEIQLFQILKEKVGEEKAKTLTEYVEARIGNQFALKPKVLQTDWNLELAELRTELYIESNKRKVETIKLLFFVVIVLILISVMLIAFSR